MKKILSFCILTTCLLSSCIEKKQTNDNSFVNTIIFQKEKAIPVAETSLFTSKKEIPLQTTDSTLIAGYPSIAIDQDNVFIYNKNKLQKIFCFGLDGQFKNNIGNVGGGPGEYMEYYDLYLNKKKKQVEIITDAGISQYMYSGQYINRINNSIPAFSFAIEQDSIYWLYMGKNEGYSPYKLFKTNNLLTDPIGFFNEESRILPSIEYTFGKESFLTYRESFKNQLYRIKGDTIIQTYDVKFPNMEIPKSLLQSDPMELLPQLAKLNYAMVRAYFENKDFVYLLVTENRETNEPHFYYWIIDKRNQKEKIIELEQVTPDSYLLSPQLLAEDNLLYLIGYPNEHLNDDVNPEANPSIFIINLEEII